MPKYIYTVKKLGELSTKNIKKVECSDIADAYRMLAYCYKQLNKKTRDNFSHIIKANSWTSLDGDGHEIVRFKFQVRHDSDNEYLHIYEFIKCSISGGYVHAV